MTSSLLEALVRGRMTSSLLEALVRGYDIITIGGSCTRMHDTILQHRLSSLSTVFFSVTGCQRIGCQIGGPWIVMECFTLEVFPNFHSAKDSSNSSTNLRSFFFSSTDKLVPSRLNRNCHVLQRFPFFNRHYVLPRDESRMPVYSIVGICLRSSLAISLHPPLSQYSNSLATCMVLGLPSSSSSSTSPSPIQPRP